MDGNQAYESRRLQVKCTYETCNKRFASVKEMKRHKESEPEHNYCKKCDVDCADWEALTQHKVEAMRPWLEGRMRFNKDESPRHITCEFCGDSFGCFRGRKTHRQEKHQADQSIQCPGCKAIFVRASLWVAHLEFGRCEVISRRVFEIAVQQKYVIAAIMKDPQYFVDRLHENKAFVMATKHASEVAKVSDVEDGEGDGDGGVKLDSILDSRDDSQEAGPSSLKPDIDLIDMKASRGHTAFDVWPRLPGTSPSPLTESMKCMKIGSSSTSTSGRGLSTGISSPVGSASVDGHHDAASDEITSMSSPSVNQHSAWTAPNTAVTLFKDAKPTQAGNWDLILKQREKQAAGGDETNIFHSRFWDPTSDEYHPDMFFNMTLRAFYCPFPECCCPCADQGAFEAHLQEIHLWRKFRCPECLKLFKCASALIAHCESVGACKVRQSDNFGKMLDEVSGGFLKAKRIDQAPIFRQSDALVKFAPTINGVMDLQFKAKMPHER